MKKIIKTVSILCAVVFTAVFCLAACSLFDWNTDIDDGFDKFEVIATDYDFTISASLEKITVRASGIGEYGNKARLVALPPYQYLRAETVHGLATDTDATPIEIDTYDCATSAEMVFDRYDENGKDRSYYKYFFLGDNGKVLVGPVYCSEFQSLYEHDTPIPYRGIKGVTSEDRKSQEVLDLGCTSTAVNFLTERLVVPNEAEWNGELILLKQTESVDSNGQLWITDADGYKQRVESFDYNGKRYYMRLDTLEYYDDIIRWYTQHNVRVILILLQRNLNDMTTQPQSLLYPNTENSKSYVQINTSNELGANYWGAIVEFLANRYSQSNNAESSKYGVVESYVLGNEIDMSTSWNAIVPAGSPPLALDDYVEEFERTMRITNNALKKYYADNKVLVSITHHWYVNGETYAPKDIIDNLTYRTIRQGNYDYGFAIHPYGYDLVSPNFWALDQYHRGMSGTLNTDKITWSNLEVLQLYLEQPSKLCDGEVRSVYLTEGGVSSYTNNNSYAIQQQCAGIAYAYYKASQLSCVKAFIYYRLIDNIGDGAYFGLLYPDGETPKAAYNMYKFIDTQYSDQVTSPYLKYISWTDFSNGQSVQHGQEIGNVQSYFDTMPLFKSKFDWTSHWDETKFILREVEDMPY